MFIVLLEGVCRFSLTKVTMEEPYFMARPPPPTHPPQAQPRGTGRTPSVRRGPPLC